LKAFALMQNKFYAKLADYQKNLVEKPQFSNDRVKMPRKPLYTSVETMAINLLNAGKPAEASLDTILEKSLSFVNNSFQNLKSSAMYIQEEIESGYT